MADFLSSLAFSSCLFVSAKFQTKLAYVCIRISLLENQSYLTFAPIICFIFSIAKLLCDYSPVFTPSTIPIGSLPPANFIQQFAIRLLQLLSFFFFFFNKKTHRLLIKVYHKIIFFFQFIKNIIVYIFVRKCLRRKHNWSTVLLPRNDLLRAKDRAAIFPRRFAAHPYIYALRIRAKFSCKDNNEQEKWWNCGVHGNAICIGSNPSREAKTFNVLSSLTW